MKVLRTTTIVHAPLRVASAVPTERALIEGNSTPEHEPHRTQHQPNMTEMVHGRTESARQGRG
jgi:hypothetical protein